MDVGFGAAPFGLDLVEAGKTRIVATGADVAALRTRVGARQPDRRVRHCRASMTPIVRFMQAYRETVDWMYSSPDALKIYGEYSGLPDSIVQRVVKLVPKEALQTEQVKDLDGVMADAVTQKFLAAPLTPDQVKELVQISEISSGAFANASNSNATKLYRVQVTSVTPAAASRSRRGPGLRPWRASTSSGVAFGPASVKGGSPPGIRACAARDR